MRRQLNVRRREPGEFVIPGAAGGSETPRVRSVQNGDLRVGDPTDSETDTAPLTVTTVGTGEEGGGVGAVGDELHAATDATTISAATKCFIALHLGLRPALFSYCVAAWELWGVRQSRPTARAARKNQSWRSRRPATNRWIMTGLWQESRYDLMGFLWIIATLVVTKLTSTADQSSPNAS